MMILVDMLPVKTGEDFHALEVHLQETKRQAQSLVCMKQHQYERTDYLGIIEQLMADFITNVTMC